MQMLNDFVTLQSLGVLGNSSSRRGHPSRQKYPKAHISETENMG